MKKNYFNAATTHTIVTHKAPRIEELLSIVLLKLNGYGEKIFPGIKTAKIEFWDAGVQTPDGRSWQHWHQKGYLLIGVGGSCFDEHANKKEDRKPGCSATLVADALGIEDAPWLEKILRYVTINDTKGGGHPYELAALVMLMNDDCFSTKPDETIEWGMNIVKAILRKQILFFNKTGDEFENCSKSFTVLHKGKEMTVCVVESDDIQMAAYARSEHGANADVVIQKYSTGRTFITSKNSALVCLDEVIRYLRLEERNINKKIGFISIDDLMKEGVIDGAEAWYYDKQARRILNGSRSNTTAPATKIPLEKVVEIVKKGLPKIFFKQEVRQHQ